MSLGPGTLVNGKYRLIRQLGEGGMGAIFEAKHEFLGTDVALKFLHPALSSRPNVVARFVQEARVSANIKSPHVVSVIDVDQSPEGLAYLVMELLRGEPLSARLAREPVLPLAEACLIAVQVLLALEAAHALGVVHRDMKPENVFLTLAQSSPHETPEDPIVKILDFGIAKLRTLGEVKKQLTRPGVVMGTPEYMAPEQVFAADAVDARADLYAVGAMLFEMVAGRRPVGGDDPRAIAGAVISGQIPRLTDVAPRVPQALSDVVAMALAGQPNDRFSSALAMRRALTNAAREANLAVNLPALPAGGSRLTGMRPLRDPPPGNLGDVGLGVAPMAMLGPGNHESMKRYDEQRASGSPHRGPGSGFSQGNSPPLGMPEVTAPVPPAAAFDDRSAGGRTVAAPPQEPRNDVGTGTISAALDPGASRDVGSGTMAAEPSPFANGMMGAALPPPVMPSTYTTSEEFEVDSRTSSRGGRRLLPILIGVGLVVGVALVAFAYLRPSSGPAEPHKSASDEDDPAKPKKKPAATDEPSKKKEPEPEPSVSAPKPSASPPVKASGTATKLPPRPTSTVTPLPTGTTSTRPSTDPFPTSFPTVLPWPPPIPT